MQKNRSLIALAVAAALSAPVAAPAADFAVRVGFENVSPKSNNGTLAGTLRADVGSDSQFTLGATAWFTPNLAADFQTAIGRFEHEVRLNGAAAATVEHRPTTLQLHYYFGDGQGFRPYVGAGWGWTNVKPKRVFGPLTGADLGLSNANGFTAEAGVDIVYADAWFVRASAEYLRFETDARLAGTPIGTVKVNPWILGLSLGYQF